MRGMAADIALLSDPNNEAKEQQVKVLAGLGYLALWAPTASGLGQELNRSLALTAASLLIVVDVVLAKACAAALELCARQRSRLRLPRPSLVLVYEPGSLTIIPRPSLEGCDTVSIVERPNVITELHAAALDCRSAARRFAAAGSR